MRFFLKSICGLAIGGVAFAAPGAVDDAECQRVRDAQAEFGRELCRQTLAADKSGHLQFALSGLWLDERTDEANARLAQAYADALGDATLMTPELAGASKVKWAMRMWLRIHYLFHEASPFHPGRLTADNQHRLRELFWNYGAAKSSLARAQLKYIWHIQGSENHDMMDLSNAFLALQAVKELPGYRERALPDGHTAAEHCAAWTAYYKQYCRERAAGGLFVEVDSPTYGKWFLPELVNMYEFADDAELRRKMEMLLHLTWADWAVDQLGGMRGGGKTRSYQGRYSQSGQANSWRAMGLILTGRGDWFDFRGGQANYVLGTTSYRLPDVVIDLALSDTRRGEYVYRSLRPARMRFDVPDAPPLLPDIWYVMDHRDPHMVRYDYCTPDYILGTLWVDPRFGTAYRPDEQEPQALPGAYAAISSQNRWQGIIFATHADARVFPQCLGTDKNHHGHTPTFHQHAAVQHENVCIVQRNRNGTQAGDMRVFFAAGMKERLIVKDSTCFLQEGDAFLAVRVLPAPADASATAWTWDDDHWMRLADANAAVVFVAGRKNRHDTLERFIESVGKHNWDISQNVLAYRFQDSDGRETRLEVDLAKAERPRINGAFIDLKPALVYDCPFLKAGHGSGVVDIQSQDRRIQLNFDRSTP